MGRNASPAIVRLSMNESVSDLVNRLRFPEAVGELVLRNCIATEPAELCKQIGRCSALRLLRCVSSVLRPSQLLQLTLEQLPRLELLELSLVVDEAVDSEMESVRGMASPSTGVTPSHGLLQMYVEVGGDRDFELLRELLKFYPKLTQLHVHFVRGYLSESVVRCYRVVENLPRLQEYTFTSELSASLPTPDVPMFSRPLRIYAAMCDNFRYERSSAWNNILELGQLVRSNRTRILPSQLVVLTVYNEHTVWYFQWASSRHVWSNVRELCILLLPSDACIEFHPTADTWFHEGLNKLFYFVRQCIVELNLSSFHFSLDFDLVALLGERLHNLNAFSVPPCALPSQSAVRRLGVICPRLRDLDVRLEQRRGHIRCRSCELLRHQEIAKPPSHAAASPSSRNSCIGRLTLCGVPSNVLQWFVNSYGAAVQLRLAEWSLVESLQCRDLFRLLGDNSAVHCLVLKHQHLPISDKHLHASLFRLTSLQHLCLLTSMQLSDDDAAKFAHEIAARARGLECVHMHYSHGADESEKRVTWLRRQSKLELLLDRPCFGCCSTATFIGLIKPVNRKCDADL